MQTLTADHDGIRIAYQRFGSEGSCAGNIESG
jgi:hypothetical protein